MMRDSISDSSVSTDILSTDAAIFKIVPGPPNSEDTHYEPIIFTTSHAIRQEDKVEMCFGYTLSRVQGTPPLKGKVILLDAAEFTQRDRKAVVARIADKLAQPQ